MSDVDDAGTTPLVRLPLPARVELRLIQVDNTMVRYQLQLADARWTAAPSWGGCTGRNRHLPLN